MGKRKTLRRRVFKVGSIAFDGGTIDCTVRNLLYRLQNSMNRRIYCQRIRSMGELFSGFEV
jgi:hypothetical protein